MAVNGAARGPVLGFVVDGESHRIRPLLGVAGATTVGPALDSAGIAAAIVSPRGDYALGVAGLRREPAIWMEGRALLRLVILPAAPDAIALSPEGSAAALYYRAEKSVRVITGLPDAPILAGRVPADAAEGLMVSDDGKLVVVAEHSTVVVAGTDGSCKRIELEGAVGAMAFAGSNHDAVIASGTQAFLIRDLELPGERRLLAAADIGPVSAAAWSSDRRLVLLAGRSSGKVAIVNLESEAVALDCQCTLAGLFRLNSRDDFRLTDYSGAALSILEAGAVHPRVVAVP